MASSLTFNPRRTPQQFELADRVARLEERLNALTTDPMLAQSAAGGGTIATLAVNGASWTSDVLAVQVFDRNERIAILGALRATVTPTVVAAAALSWTVAVKQLHRTQTDERTIGSFTFDERATSLSRRSTAPIVVADLAPGIGRHEFRVVVTTAITAISTLSLAITALDLVARRTLTNGR